MLEYDEIYLDYPLELPSYIPDKAKATMLIDFAENGFQTKDLTKDLSSYYINNNGKLFLNSDPFISDKKELTRIDYHGYMNIYTVVLIGEGKDIPMHKKRNIWVSFKLKFTDGWLVNAQCTSPTELDVESLELAHM
jgi:hypothetical protein